MKHRTPELFVGITSWDSAQFLGRCLQAVRDTTRGVSCRLVVLDNVSSDDSARIAREHGAEVIVRGCSQPDALNRLLAMSRSPCTLLAHSDVVMLSPRWFDLCRAQLRDDVALVSPEDIGCGPYSRDFGAGQPESSFLFFDTAKARKSRITLWERGVAGLRWPRRVVDFYGPHITHHLPARLEARGYSWKAMNVLISPAQAEPIYRPAFAPCVWTEELANLRYGLGNFYSLGGEVTHYHNWYDRVGKDVDPASQDTTAPHGAGFPVAYISRYTQNFLSDLDAGRLVLPSPVPPARTPRAL